jgi:hypothetical protein
MANRRSKVVDAIGFTVVADTVTLTATKVLTVTFPAKTVVAVIAASTADTDAEKIVWASSVTAGLASVTFTATSAGATNTFSYIIIATPTETIAANALTDDTTETPKP